MSKEFIEKMREKMEYQVHCETWQTKWLLHITGEQGWFDDQQREQFERMLELTENKK